MRCSRIKVSLLAASGGLAVVGVGIYGARQSG